MSQNRSVPGDPRDPWAELATRCQQDAFSIVDAAIARACADGHARPYISTLAAFDALATLYAALMADHAKLTAQVDSLRKRVDKRNWVSRMCAWLGEKQ